MIFSGHMVALYDFPLHRTCIYLFLSVVIDSSIKKLSKFNSLASENIGSARKKKYTKNTISCLWLVVTYTSKIPQHK